MTIQLTKSNFLLGMQCKKAIWLRFNNDDVRDATGPGLQRLFQEGHNVGRLAHGLFPGGTLINLPSTDANAVAGATAEAIAKNPPAIFEGGCTFDHVFVRADVLRQVADGWDLIEVKASGSLKDEHIDDVAVQWHVLRGSGIPVKRAFVMHINGDYVRQGDIDLNDLFIEIDVTAQVEEKSEEVATTIESIRETIALTAMPNLDVGSHCGKPYDCRFTGFCWDPIPKTSIHYIPRLHKNKRAALLSLDVRDQRQIPDDFDLSDAQVRWVRASKSGAPVINRKVIDGFLSRLKYPLTFLDFETLNLAIPPYDGLSPFDQLPFQASARIVDDTGAERHEEFLADGTSDPRAPLAKFLAAHLPATGSVIAYHASFEKGRLNDLAGWVPSCAPQLLSLVDRLADLEDVFLKGGLVDSRFGGSTSIKAVLPVLVPGMSYDKLAVKDGGEAMAAYLRLMSDQLEPSDRKQIMADLTEYCGQDTEAMVKVWGSLKGFA